MRCLHWPYSAKLSKLCDNKAMGIGHYIKEIGRGKDGARALTREQAADLLGQILDQQVTDLEIGAFCLAMRIKGETPSELAGFLDAVHSRLNHLALPQAANAPATVVIPCYNGARKLPALAPLLALLLVQAGARVCLHGTPTESGRVNSFEVLAQLGHLPNPDPSNNTEALQLLRTETLHTGLKNLLEVRRVVGLRNPAHSLVKLMNPCAGPALRIASYTHPEYAVSMAETFKLTQASAFLLRGTEGEPVADPRRTPQMEFFNSGISQIVQTAQAGSLVSVPDLPTTDAFATAHYIQAVLNQQLPVPKPIRLQVDHILQALKSL
jgi:anthranilate phosphoribosyltransferase